MAIHLARLLVVACFAAGVHEVQARSLDRTSLTGVPAGQVTMLSLRVPLGAPPTREFLPQVILAHGPAWREAPGSVQGNAPRFAPTMMAGVKFDGAPILSFGSVDFTRAIANRMNASAEAGSTSDRSGVYVLVGLAAVGLAVWAVNASVDTYEAFDEVIDEDSPS